MASNCAFQQTSFQSKIWIQIHPLIFQWIWSRLCSLYKKVALCFSVRRRGMWCCYTCTLKVFALQLFVCSAWLLWGIGKEKQIKLRQMLHTVPWRKACHKEFSNLAIQYTRVGFFCVSSALQPQHCTGHPLPYSYDIYLFWSSGILFPWYAAPAHMTCCPWI